MMVAQAFAERILIVEDEAVVALDIQDQLESLGYLVVGKARSAEEACRHAAQLQPDLVLMDIRLQGEVDGIQAAEQIREGYGIPIVFLTAFVDESTLQRAKTVEPYGYLVKPFDSRELHTTLQVALHKGKCDRALLSCYDDLLTVLNAQRQGTVLLDYAGRVTLLSHSARQLLGAEDSDRGTSWRELLNLDEEKSREVEQTLGQPQRDRRKLVAHRPAAPGRASVVEIEVRDDPRHEGGRILLVYDVTPLYAPASTLDEKARFENIVGKSKPIADVIRLIHEIAAVDSTTLIEGETGTGKELVARAIHNRSPRRSRPFLALNCAGLSETLATSQLFGHRKGAFTGAVTDQIGIFEAAAGGTLFLDEIGELPLSIQTMLLRALEERAVVRVGESVPRSVNARIIAATNASLAKEVEAKRFRADLLYRIRVARISLPPLRDRREDIPLLAATFLADDLAGIGGPIEGLSNAAMGALLDYSWPGNVRELKNALEFAVIHAAGPTIQLTDLPPEILEGSEFLFRDKMSDDPRAGLIEALRRSGGNRREAAKLLGMSRATLYRRLAEYRIND